jgi:hypothetical protein
MTAQLKDFLAQHPETARFSNDDDVKLFSNSMQEVFKQEAQQGDRTFIKNLFDGEDKYAYTPVMVELCAKVSASLQKKGMQETDARLLSNTALPAIFNTYNHQIKEARLKGIDIPQIIDDVLSGKFNYADMGKLMSLAGIFTKGRNSFLKKLF